MLNSVMGSMELFFLYMVLVSVLFARFRGEFAMVHTAVAKSQFVGFGIFMVAVAVGMVSDFEAADALRIAILGNAVSLWAYMLKHVWFAYKCSLPAKPVPTVTEEEVMLTADELDELGISPKVKSKLLANLEAGVYDTVHLGLTDDDEDPMASYSDDGSVI